MQATDATLLIYDLFAERYLAQLRPAFPDLRIVATFDRDEAFARARNAEILMLLAQNAAPELLRAAPRLRWIQVLTSGTDGTTDNPALPPDVLVTSARGIHGPQVAELALLLMLMLRRDVPRMLDQQRRRIWNDWPQPLLLGTTAVIVGVGTIAETLAERCRAFGMTTIGVSTSRTEAPGFDRIVPRTALAAAAGEGDFVVALTPRRPETIGLIDDAVLTTMKPSAYLINVARGGVVDEAALVDHLRRGSIAGAGLDVFATEPLPAQSPLWELPNVIVTPHVGGLSATYVEQLAPILIENLRAFFRNDIDAMRNVVRRPDVLRPPTAARNSA